MPLTLALDEAELGILQKSYAAQVASERFHRYVEFQDKDSKNFTEEEAARRFKLLQQYLKELKNFCILVGSDN